MMVMEVWRTMLMEGGTSSALYLRRDTFNVGDYGYVEIGDKGHMLGSDGVAWE
jgi:hypothetical protein